MENADKAASEESDITMQGKHLDAPLATIEDIEEAYNNFLHLNDTIAIRVVLAAFIANRFESHDPVWLLLVAPSSTGKTEFINGLMKVPGTHMISTVTPNTFLSGLTNRKRDPSLLTRLGPRSVLLQKDFTSILSMRPDSRAEILGQLREIYDGYYAREFGTGVSKKWEGKLGFISGCTLEIEKAIMTGSRLGDRFLYWRIAPVDELAALDKITANISKAHEFREIIQLKVAGFLNSVEIPDVVPNLPSNYEAGISRLAIFAMMCRAFVDRDTYSSKDILDVAMREGSIRFFKELIAVGQALAVMNRGSFELSDYHIITKLCLDAIPSRRYRLVSVLENQEEWMTTSEIADAVSLPTRTTGLIMEELQACCVVRRRAKPRGESGGANAWMLTVEAGRLLTYRHSPDGPDKTHALREAELLKKEKTVVDPSAPASTQDIPF